MNSLYPPPKKQKQTTLITLFLLKSMRLLLFSLLALFASSSYAFAGTISGTVTDNAGNPYPIGGIKVSASLKAGNNWEYGGYTATDLDGKYTISNLPAGEYRIYFDGSSSRFASETFDNASHDNPTLITLTENETKTADAKLDLNGVVLGKVTDINGNHVEDVFVSAYYYDAYNESWSYYSGTHTDIQGEYIFPYALDAGTYRFKFELNLDRPGHPDDPEFPSNSLYFEYYNNATTLYDAQDVVITNNESKIINVVLGDLPSSTITGTVMLGGFPVREVFISPYLKVGDGWELQWDPVRYDTMETNNYGEYTISNLPAGEYRIAFGGWGFTSEVSDILLAEGEVKTVDVEVERNINVRGKVTDITGNPVTDVIVSAYYYDAYNESWSYYSGTHTDIQGEYMFTLGFDAGTYRFKYQSDSQGFEYYKDATTIDDAQDVVITNNDEKTIDVVLGDLASGTITGTVTDNAGNPIEEISVYANLKAGNNWESGGYAVTDADGKYTISNLPVGDYRINFQGYSKGVVSETFDNATNDNPTLITLADGETKTANAELDKKGVVHGKVTDINGNPVADISVSTYYYDTYNESWYPNFNSYAHTNGDGEYIFYRGLDAGTYRFKFRHSYRDEDFEYYKDATTIDDAQDVMIANNDDKTINIILGAPDEVEVSAEATDGTATEAPDDTGLFTISRTGDTSTALTVKFTLGGTAENGKDYKKIGNSITIPAGQSSAVLEIVPINDNLINEEDETVIISLIDPVTTNQQGRATKQAKSKQLAALVTGGTATITIINNATATAIPTLQQWAIILLIILLLMISWQQSKMRKQQHL